jgi:aspartyl-tRNA(Asn)/glutamyl-tRNA(Gln) amidotransferase subunit A
MDDRLAALGIEELGSGYRRGDFTPSEAVGTVLARISEENPRLNALLHILVDQATEAAAVATAQLRAGIDLGPLHGVPVTVKDNVHIRGVRTTCASRVLEDEPPATEDAWIVRALRSAGAIVVGKTNLSEFAYGDPDPDGPFGIVQNPRRMGHHTGTSSSGAGAAAAAGFGALAIGTDTGGSVRHPAAVCGLAGMKPTFGRLPLDGIVPNNPRADHIGLMTRSVRDLETAFRAIDPLQPTRGVDPELLDLPGTPRLRTVDSMRIGVVTDPSQGRGHPEILAVFDAVAADLRSITAGTPPVDLDAALLARTLAAVSEWSAVALAETHRPYADRAHLYAKGFVERTRIGKDVTGLRLNEILTHRRETRRALLTHLESCDMILMPANLHPSPPHSDTTIQTPSGPLPFRAVNSYFDKIGSLTGFPSIIVPVGTVEGLPVAVQLLAAPGHEDWLFTAGRALESVRGSASDMWGIEIREDARA